MVAICGAAGERAAEVMPNARKRPDSMNGSEGNRPSTISETSPPSRAMRPGVEPL